MPDQPLSPAALGSGMFAALPLDGEQLANILPLNSRSNVYENRRAVKSGVGVLVGFTVYNSGPAQFIQWHDTLGLPVAGAAPEGFVEIATLASRGLNWIPGRTFQRGIVLVNSTTGPTYTAGAADCYFDAQYV
jgi:hypothetical protein